MTWNDAQRAELAAQYRRIGYVEGERWPAPPPALSPDDVLKLLREIPDGGGRTGYVEALGRSSR